jgi:hypothetical protein
VLLHPLKDPVPPPLAARSRAIHSMLAEISHAEALDLACRTLAGVLPRVPTTLRGIPGVLISSEFRGDFASGHVHRQPPCL